MRPRIYLLLWYRLITSQHDGLKLWLKCRGPWVVLLGCNVLVEEWFVFKARTPLVNKYQIIHSQTSGWTHDQDINFYTTWSRPRRKFRETWMLVLKCPLYAHTLGVPAVCQHKIPHSLPMVLGLLEFSFHSYQARVLNLESVTIEISRHYSRHKSAYSHSCEIPHMRTRFWENQPLHQLPWVLTNTIIESFLGFLPFVLPQGHSNTRGMTRRDTQCRSQLLRCTGVLGTQNWGHERGHCCSNTLSQ